MKKLFILFLYTIFSCSSDTPVNMDEVLFDSGGRFKSLESKKVYSGPGFKEYRNGKKQEQGANRIWMENWESGLGWYEDGKKKYEGRIFRGESRMDLGLDFIPMDKKNMKVVINLDSKLANGLISIKKELRD